LQESKKHVLPTFPWQMSIGSLDFMDC